MSKHFLLIFILIILGCNTTQNIQNPNIEEELVGTWLYVEMRNHKGDTIDSYDQRIGKVKASGPKIILNADKTYEKIFFPGKSDTGNWSFNRSEMSIEYNLYIDSTDFVGKSLIKKGLAVKYPDGKYYERITDKLIDFQAGQMIIDTRGNQTVYKKESSPITD